MICCAAGDPGGSRALLPVIEELERRGLPCLVLDHGFLGQELPESLRHRLCPLVAFEARIAACRLFLFGSSATDSTALSLARRARGLGLPAAHILDNWSSYSSRLCTDGLEMFVPELYAVMDAQAEAGALDENVPASCLAVTGHPGMARVAMELETLAARDKANMPPRPDSPGRSMHLAFVNEPFRAVLGADPQAPGHPGFTEDQVLAALARALDPHKEHVRVSILPHPKQSAEDVAELWARVRGEVAGGVIKLREGRDIFGDVDGVAGMASILLYEAWLVGLPLLCLQPDVRLASMRRFAMLEGIAYASSEDAIPAAVSVWLALCRAGGLPVRPELALHVEAPARIAQRLICLMETGRV